MPPVYLFEDSQVERLFPLTYTRAAFELRIGGLTLLERLQRNLGQTFPIAGLLMRSPLAEIVRRRIPGIPINPPLSARDGILLINARLLQLGKAPPWAAAPDAGASATADGALASTADLPPQDSAGLIQSTVAWMHLSPALAAQVDLSKLQTARTIEEILEKVQRKFAHAIVIDRPWQLLDHQRAAILEDFAAIGAAGDPTAFPGAHFLNPGQIHLAAGVKIWPGAVLDAQTGPIIVGEGSEIHANAVITGPVSIGPHCMIRNLADIREETVLGPGCRVGGEIIASVFLGNANKQHHGFLGQSIVGEWANLGAGTTTSNVKNTYGSVRMISASVDEPTNRQFMGSLIADHVKLGIGTYLSTGSVVGFASHVVVPRPPRFVPSFAWLTEKGLHRADFEKLEQIADIVMRRRHAEFTPADHELWVRIASEWSQSERFTWTDQ